MDKKNIWVSRYAKTTIAAAFTLILIGSLVTTNGAGMAFADWPLSASSLNPAGWWSNLFQRLEHGHRLFAELTGCMVGILCAWVWGNLRAVPAAFLGSGLLALLASFSGASRPLVAHIGLWSSAIIFAALLLWQHKPDSVRSPLTRWLAFAAFIGVIAQAILGGLRVTIESGGDAQTAMIFRVLHGCCAQIELCLLVAIAATLSPRWSPSGTAYGAAKIPGLRTTRVVAWAAFGLVFLQLTAGATMRHHGVGLIIPTFPQAAPDGSWLPAVHSFLVELNFAHTRIGALLVGLCGVLLARRILGGASEGSGLVGPAWLLLGLIASQITLGILILFTHRAILPTTLHVLNGAAILATSFVLALRSTLLEPGEPAFFSGHEPLPGVAS